jgi:endonuclease YncB( thermonuclease family)
MSTVVVMAGFAFGITPGAMGEAAAGEVLPGPVAATVVRVIDGDTVRVRALVWLGSTVEVDVRLAGIDAPELRGRCAREKQLAAFARDALHDLLDGGPVALRDVTYGKYAGRVIARVTSPNGDDAAESLRVRGLARAYTGGKRRKWCGT